MDKIYLDTNIIIAYTIGSKKEPDQHRRAKLVIDGISQGRYAGVISILALTELMGVIRMLVSKNKEEMIRIPEKKQDAYVKDKASKIYQSTTSTIMRLPNVKLEKGGSARLDDVLARGLELMEKSIGSQRFHKKYEQCSADHVGINYKQVMFADILHAIIAHDSQCDELYTFDKGFLGLRGLDEIEPLKITIP